MDLDYCFRWVSTVPSHRIIALLVHPLTLHKPVCLISCPISHHVVNYLISQPLGSPVNPFTPSDTWRHSHVRHAVMPEGTPL